MDFLNWYEKRLRQKGCAETSISVFFRTLRSVYNKAIEAKQAKKINYLFDDFKVSKLCIKTEKRAISKDNIKHILILV